MIANEQKSRWHRIPLYDKSKIACHGDQRIQWYSNNLGIDDNWVIDEVEHLYTPLRIKNHISHTEQCRDPTCRAKSPVGTTTKEFKKLDFGMARYMEITTFPRVKCKKHGIKDLKPER